MSFFSIGERFGKNGVREIYPEFKVAKPTDLMVRGKAFYALWNEEKGLWSTDEFDAAKMIDKELYAYRERLLEDPSCRDHIVLKPMSVFSSNSWLQFQKYLKSIPDTNKTLDEKLTFQDTVVTKDDYVSKRLPYPLKPGPYSAYDEIIGTLYDPDERQKIEWAIGAVVAGEARNIQKFMVFYGDAGAGKSTILNIIQKLFEGYYTTFEAKALVSSSNAFSTEVFRSNPLVAIQHDGDLSRIEDNTKLNSLVSHEEMVMNEKFKQSYTSRANCFLFMATNRPVKITDAKSGIIRRLIDVKPSGHKLTPDRYFELFSKVDFELGAIACHCLEVFNKLGPNYYANYRPISMIFKTDVFFNFVESCYDDFKENDGVTLLRAYDLYKSYCESALVDNKLPKYKFREELKNYFDIFYNIVRIDGKQVRSYYKGFIASKFEELNQIDDVDTKPKGLIFDKAESLFDKEYGSCAAQLTKEDGTPRYSWANVRTSLRDLNTHELHYVKPPEHMIVIDFDIKKDGQKSQEENLKAASGWPPTYGEFSKGGGVHLHYIYDGDVSMLSSVYAPGIEVKVFTGGSSLRRKLSYCNDIPIATINSGLPLKERDKVIDKEIVLNEKALKTLILRACNKEHHGHTKPEVEFIYSVLERAYNSGMTYDVGDYESLVFRFATRSSNNSKYCRDLVSKMKFRSADSESRVQNDGEGPFTFFDIEVFPNLLLICYKERGEGKPIVDLVNPAPSEVEELFKKRLIGFNNRRYDNHICYARYLGKSIEDCYNLSQLIIGSTGMPSVPIEGYSVSYTDIFDFASKKQSLKKWEIELGIHHHELDLPWDQPVPEELWAQVIEYCHYDVLATEAVFNHKDIRADFDARKMLAAITGRSVNDKTNTLTAALIFKGNKNHRSEMHWRDLSKPVKSIEPEMFEFLKKYKPEMLERWNGEGGSILPYFPGYVYKNGVSSYRDFEKIGEGGLVWAKPGMYWNVVTFDVESMHPNSAIAEYLMGVYTSHFADLVQARLYIKHKEYARAAMLFDGKLKPYLNDSETAEQVASALKIAINSVYGLTSASFENEFYDEENIDNIVAKRGALAMIDIKAAVEAHGGEVIHVKTDSIKIVNPSEEITQLVMDLGKKYGYNFAVEAIYERICLVNNAVYIAKGAYNDPKHPNEWIATGAQFKQPFVFKTLFTHEPITPNDLRETKNVNGGSAMYVNANEQKLRKIEGFKPEWLFDPELAENDLKKLGLDINDYSCNRFVGKCGQFTPILADDVFGPMVAVKPGTGGGWLVYKNDRGETKFVAGSKGYRWMEAENVDILGLHDHVDLTYYSRLADEARDSIKKFGDFEAFVA